LNLFLLVRDTIIENIRRGKCMRILTEKEAESILNEMESDYSENSDELIVEIEDLRHNLYLFQIYVSEVKNLYEENRKLFEAKTKQNEINELIELYTNIQVVDKRIQNNIEKIKNLLDAKPQLSQTFVKDTNQSFLDMFTNYEITVARYSKFLHEFDITLPSKKLSEPMKHLTNSMNLLNDIVVDFNNFYPYKLLQPFEESQIAETIHVYGFGIVKEKDWSNLVKYRG
jgi:hypothetical protein